MFELELGHDLLDSEGFTTSDKDEAFIKRGRFISYCIGEDFRVNRKDHTWDGYIHPSQLNWRSKPETQASKLINKGKTPLVGDPLRAFMVGDHIHDQVEKMVKRHIFSTGYAEVPLVVKKWLFKGTADYVGYTPALGWTLIDFKSYSELQRDKAFGQRLAKDLGLTWDDLSEETQTYLSIKERQHDNPDPAHLTQAFTYTYFFNKYNEFLPFPKIKTVAICYIGKDKMRTREFYLPLNKNKHLLKKTVENYSSVYRLIKEHLNESPEA